MQILRRVTADEVYCQFLRSELHTFRDCAAYAYLASLAANPDLGDADQNAARNLFLHSKRGSLLKELPWSVEWHSATTEPGDFKRFRLIGGDCGWDDKAADNMLCDVRFPSAFDKEKQRKIEEISTSLAKPDFDRTLILIAKTKDGPFTIIDGNHRATAMMALKRAGSLAESDVKAYLGVSPQADQCRWYAPGKQARS
jgi:hypothetical protein